MLWKCTEVKCFTQISARWLDKRRLRERAGRIPEDDMRRVDEALGVSMGLHDQPVAQSTHMDGGYF